MQNDQISAPTCSVKYYCYFSFCISHSFCIIPVCGVFWLPTRFSIFLFWLSYEDFRKIKLNLMWHLPTLNQIQLALYLLWSRWWVLLSMNLQFRPLGDPVTSSGRWSRFQEDRRRLARYQDTSVVFSMSHSHGLCLWGLFHAHVVYDKIFAI